MTLSRAGLVRAMFLDTSAIREGRAPLLLSWRAFRRLPRRTARLRGTAGKRSPKRRSRPFLHAFIGAPTSSDAQVL